MSTVKPIPEGSQPLTPYLVVKEAARAIDFYKNAFAAIERYRLSGPDGKIGHAEIEISGCRIMLADEFPDFGALSPVTIGGTPITLHLYVEDVDSAVKKAAAAGATVLREPKDEFYGDRAGMVVDPFGHKWHLASHKEDVTPEEMEKRWKAMMS